MLYIANTISPITYKEVENIPLGKIDHKENLIDIGAYVLMPNHFHLLVRQKEEIGLSKFMEKLSTGYSMYFNKKYDRSGALFQGAFKAQHVDRDEYLKYLFAYIHLNPIKMIDANWNEELARKQAHSTEKKFLENYQFSSYLDWAGVARDENRILNKGAFPEYFSAHTEFTSYIEDWLNFQNFQGEPSENIMA